MTKVTPNRELYCQARADGKNQTESYLHGYPSSRTWKNRNSVTSEASIAEARPDIQARIAELKKPAADLLERHRTKIIQKLLDIGLKNKKVNQTTVSALSKLIDKLVATKSESKIDANVEANVHIHAVTPSDDGK